MTSAQQVQKSAYGDGDLNMTNCVQSAPLIALSVQRHGRGPKESVCVQVFVCASLCVPSPTREC